MDHTLQQLADELNLSLMSISRALQGRGGVSEETRLRVQTAADAMGYRPNQIARALLSGRTDSIGIVARDFNSPETAAIFGLLETQFQRRGLQVLPASHGDVTDDELATVNKLAGRRVHGLVILLDSAKFSDPLQSVIRESRIPTVLVALNAIMSQVHPVAKMTDSVILVRGDVVQKAVQHLRQSDHKRILVLVDDDFNRDAVGAVGADLVVEKVGGMRDAENAARRVGATYNGIVTTTAEIAAGAVRGVRRAGRSIGRRFQDDISIICTSESPAFPLLDPTMTAYSIPVVDIAGRCVELLTTHLKLPAKWVPQLVLYEPMIVRRESA